MKAAQSAIDRQKARRRAIEHAATVREGTVLKTFDPRADHSEPVWVVFSADDPIAVPNAAKDAWTSLCAWTSSSCAWLRLTRAKLTSRPDLRLLAASAVT